LKDIMTDTPPPNRDALVAALGGRSIVLVGMMGAGKTSVGRRLAARLNLPFADADAEIEAGAQMSVPEIFERFGETYFREGERKVLARLMAEGQKVLATGGGAFMNEATRRRIAESGVSIWLKPDFDVLVRRVRKRSNRPLLQTSNPEETLRRILEERSPIYGQADLTIESREGPHDAVVEAIVSGLGAHLAKAAAATSPNGERGAPAAQIQEVEVALGYRAYKILIGEGLMASAGAHIARLAPGAHCAVVTDDNVAAAHLGALAASLAQAGLRTSTIVVPPGEASKSYARFAEVCDGLLAAHIERRDIVIALGGGVVGDLAGFPAANSHDLARAGRFFGRRQDRDQFASWQESGRRFSSALACPGRHRRARYAECARISRWLCRDGQIRVDRRPRVFRMAGGPLARRICGRPRAPSRSGDELRGKGGGRGGRRNRTGRACAAQSWPHIRPCF
jgi:shikimate kinase/3-dehydroquinate synthase